MHRPCQRHLPPDRMSVMLLQGQSDAAWIFINVEGVVAKLRGAP